jgi:hypothetical protein
MPGGMEADLVDAVAVAVVHPQLRGVLVGLEPPCRHPPIQTYDLVREALGADLPARARCGLQRAHAGAQRAFGALQVAGRSQPGDAAPDDCRVQVVAPPR